jgi:hypothetical protein
MKKVTRPVPKPRSGPTPRPILAMATPPNDRPMVTIDRLKGGEINWSLKTPASSVGVAITRALDEAKKLIRGCMDLEELERRHRTLIKETEAREAEEQRAKQEAKKKKQEEEKAA